MQVKKLERPKGVNKDDKGRGVVDSSDIVAALSGSEWQNWQNLTRLVSNLLSMTTTHGTSMLSLLCTTYIFRTYCNKKLGRGGKRGQKTPLPSFPIPSGEKEATRLSRGKYRSRSL